MPTIKELAENYGCSKSTMRRWIENAGLGDVLGTGNPIELTQEQTAILAHYLAPRKTPKQQPGGEPQPAQQTGVESLQERIHGLEKEVARLEGLVQGKDETIGILKSELDRHLALEAAMVNRLHEQSTDQQTDQQQTDVIDLSDQHVDTETSNAIDTDKKTGFWANLKHKLFREK